MLSRDQTVLEQQIEIDHLREQSIRHNAIISSLKKKVKDLEEREQNLYAGQGRTQLALHTFQRNSLYYKEIADELEKKLKLMELECANKEHQTERAKFQYHELIERLDAALSTYFCESNHPSHSPEILIAKATELVQDTNRLKSRVFNLGEDLSSTEKELEICRDTLKKTNADKEIMQRQISLQLLEIDKLRQDKESLAVENRVVEGELHQAKDKLFHCCTNLWEVSDNVDQNKSRIMQLKDDLKLRDEKYQRLEGEFRNSMESIAILLSLPTRFVESNDSAIKERIREILNDNKDKTAQIDALRDKVNLEAQQRNRTERLQEQSCDRVRILENERILLEAKVHNLERVIHDLELSKESFKRDKTNFLIFLERLSRSLNMDKLSTEACSELFTETILHRAEQLAWLESDKTAVVYQLQRKVRILREQIQRKDLHIEMLKRKLALQEESCKLGASLRTENYETQARVKKLNKQVDKLSLQLWDARATIRNLSNQLADAAHYKITALERARQIDQLEKRVSEAEFLRARYGHKVEALREQVRVADEYMQLERERGSSDC